MFIFRCKFNNLQYQDPITEKSETSKKNQWDFQISKVGSLDFLDLKVNGSPALKHHNLLSVPRLCLGQPVQRSQILCGVLGACSIIYNHHNLVFAIGRGSGQLWQVPFPMGLCSEQPA